MKIVFNLWSFRATNSKIIDDATPEMKMTNFSSKALGGLGFQAFHQRTLSACSTATAKLTCIAAAFILLLMGIPLVLLGAAAASTGDDHVPFHTAHKICVKRKLQKRITII